jgi:transcriptional regulator with XRE-family HTH domain
MANEFGTRLRRMRAERDWSLRELAAKAGTHFAYLSQIESGVAKPSAELVEKLADAFDLRDRQREEFIFVAREIREQIQEIKQKFPNMSAGYFRKVTPKGKR